MANALRLGFSPDDYARQCQISPNTVYTHIRRLKEKTGSARMAELIRKLNDVQVAVVAKREV
ncbi:MAG: helix-turn-helix transcriptional regulator [Xanthobacteraceae bacterium]